MAATSIKIAETRINQILKKNVTGRRWIRTMNGIGRNIKKDPKRTRLILETMN